MLKKREFCNVYLIGLTETQFYAVRMTSWSWREKRRRSDTSLTDMNPNKLQHADRVIWIAVAVVAGAVLVSSALGPFQIEWASFRKAALVDTLLISASWFYLTIRKDALLAEALMSAAQIIAFASVAAPCRTSGRARHFPYGILILPHWTIVSVWTGRRGLLS